MRFFFFSSPEAKSIRTCRRLNKKKKKKRHFIDSCMVTLQVSTEETCVLIALWEAARVSPLDSTQGRCSLVLFPCSKQLQHVTRYAHVTQCAAKLTNKRYAT